LTLNYFSTPSHYINFLAQESDIDSYECREALQEARHWLDLLRVIKISSDLLP